jgi:medium-chain acyl-[acyl-carrier-protein] hydrolase
MTITSTKLVQEGSLWFSPSRSNGRSAVRLFCFPYAGGGALIYRTWLSARPELFEAMPVRLPGREARLNEAPFRRIGPLVEALGEAILPYLDRPFAFFGHSMGAKLAFELARLLSRRGFEPAHLFVSGARGPQIPRTEPPTYTLSGPEFVEKLRDLNGTPNEVLEHPELMGLMIPLLRADFELVQTYDYNPGPLLRCPITAYGGLKDRDVLKEQLAAWGRETSSAFALRMFPGDHFFINSDRALVLQSVCQELQGQARRRP